MKKIILTTLLVFTSSVAFAANPFTSLKLSDASAPAKTEKAAPAEDGLGNVKIQNAILQIDNAQTEIRNQLLDLKTKYADIDAQYVSVKAERKVLKQQLRQSEKRLKDLDNAKEKMRKNML